MSLGRLPVDGHRVFTHQRFFLLAQRLFRRLHDARVNHLAASCNVAVFAELPVHGLKDALAGAGLDQALFESPDRRPVRDLAAGAQSHKALKAQTVEQLEFHLLVAQIEQLLDQQDPHHQFGGKWRTATALAARAVPHGRLPPPMRQSQRAAPSPSAHRPACSAWLRAPGRQTDWF